VAEAQEIADSFMQSGYEDIVRLEAAAKEDIIASHKKDNQSSGLR
jgi:hypothetical protein